MSRDLRLDERIPARPPLVGVLLALAATLVLLDTAGPAGPAVAGVRAVARTVLAPAESGGEALVAPLRAVRDALAGPAALRAENDALRGDLAAARAEAAALQAAAAEGRRLAAAVPSPAGRAGAARAGTPARVVSLPGPRAGSTFLLDRGTEAGLRPGMPVLAAGALVGRVVEAVRGAAAVLPLTDGGFAAGVRLSGSGEVGVASGRSRGRALRLELLDPTVPVADGELVVTAGLHGSRFPGGLPVGRVRAAGAAAEVVPVVPPTRLELVEVLPWVAP